MAELSEFKVGQTVELADGRIAKVHFIGHPHFADGEWLGVELEDASGKNDGAVQGQRYFECAPGYGMFLRPAAATIIENSIENLTKAAIIRTNGPVAKIRPQSLAVPRPRNQNIFGSITARRQSINAGSPTPAKRSLQSSRLGSPTKSSTKSHDSASSSSDKATPSISTNTATNKVSTSASLARRPLMGPPSSFSTSQRLSRTSTIGKMNGSVKAPGHISSSSSCAPTKNLSIRNVAAAKKFGAESVERPASASSGQPSPVESLAPGVLSPATAQSKDDQSVRVPDSTVSRTSALNNSHAPDKPDSTRRISPASLTQRGVSAGPALSREVEEMKTKLKLIEKRRIGDRDKLKDMERLQTERDKFENIIQKLQSKYQPLQQELSDLKMQLKDEGARCKSLEAQLMKSEEVAEVATVEREMAEENFELLKVDFKALNEKHEEKILELDILRGENEELVKDMSPEEKSSRGWLQMEKSNERYKEALLRLRDITQQKEAGLRNQVGELEKDVEELKAVKDENTQTKSKLLQAESAIEDLKHNLETALGADEMIEELTSKNLALAEEIDSLKKANEELEVLKELGDEIESNNVETEKQLRDDLAHKDTIIAEQVRKSASQDETTRDLEYTLSKFRDVVGNMNRDLEDMRLSKQITESEANDMTSRSRAMMDLNMRLQVSASKAQVKAIDLELRKLDAQEATEHLQIVQLFLPETMKTERISILAFLCFKRLGFKASMIHGFIKERVSEQPCPGHEEAVLICCDILDKLVWISGICNRFVQSIQTSTLEAFGQLEGALYELEPVERAMNGWIDGLKRDDLKEEQCAVELQRSIALMTHLGEKHINEGLEQHADDIHMRATMIQSYLENSAAALSQMKMVSQAKIPPSSEGAEDYQHMQDFLKKTGSLVMQTSNAKVVARKAISQIQDLKSRSLTLDPSTVPTIEQCQNSAFELASLTRSVGILLVKLVNEEGRNTPFSYQEISFAISSSQSTSLLSLSSKIQATTANIQNFYNITSSLIQTVEFSSPPPPTPWQLLAHQMHAETVALAMHKSEVGRLKDDLVEKHTTLAIREKIVEEMSVKVEVLEKRLSESAGQRERARELEATLNKTVEKEKSLLTQLKRQQFALEELEAQQESWKKHNQKQNSPSSNGDQITISGSKPSAVHNTDVLLAQIRLLISTVCYLRERCASYEQSLCHSSNSSISTPLTPKRPSRTRDQRHKSEAGGVLREGLRVVSSAQSRLVRLSPSKREERLKWKPTKETSPYLLAKQRGEWDVLGGWAESVARRKNEENMRFQILPEYEPEMNPYERERCYSHSEYMRD